MKFCSLRAGIILISLVVLSFSVCESQQSEHLNSLAVHQIDLTDRILYSESSDRSDAILLQDAFIRGNVFIFAELSDIISILDVVEFYIDDPAQTFAPSKVERIAPYDLQGGSEENASPYNTVQLDDGVHSLTVVIIGTGTSSAFTVEFNVANTQSFLISSVESLQFFGSPAGDQFEQLVIVSAEDGQSSILSISIVDQIGSGWISLTATNGILPAGETFEFTVFIDSTGLSEGMYSARVIINSETQVQSVISVSLSVLEPQLLGIPSDLGFITEENQNPAALSLQISTSNQLPTDITLSFSQPWLTLNPNSGSIPASGQLNVVLSIDSTGLSPGDYSGELVTSSPQYPSVITTVSLSIQASGQYDLVISATSNRVNPIPFGNNQVVSGFIYVFVSPENGINQVEFYIDTPSIENASPLKIERIPAYDLAGTDPAGLAMPFDTTLYSDGSHVLTANILTNSGNFLSISSFIISNENVSPELVINPSNSLAFTAVTGQVSSEQIISIGTNDNSGTQVTLLSSETWLNISPLSGTIPDNGGSLSVAISADASTLTQGVYNAVVSVSPAEIYDAVVISIELTVAQQPMESIYQILYSTTSDRQNPLELNGASVTGDLYVFVLPESGISTIEFYFDGVLSSIERIAPFDLQGGTSLNANPFDTTLRADGNHEISIVVTQTNGQIVESTVTFVIENNNGCIPFPSQFEGEEISSLSCALVRVALPYSALFGSNQPSIPAGNGQATGFTMYMPRDDGESGYNPVDLLITADNELELIARVNSWQGSQNNHVNALGVGIPLPDTEMRSTVTLKLPDSPPGFGEKACLFFGISFRDYIMLCVVSNGNGESLQLVYEIEDVPSTTNFDLISNINPNTRLITLQLVMTPLTNTVTLLQLDESSQEFVVVTILEDVEPNWFSKDAAGIDITVGTRSYTGIHVTSSDSSSSVSYIVASFEVEAVLIPEPTPEPGSNDEDFDWFTTGIGSVMNPTSMQFGPDEKLYVTSVFGSVYRITFDFENQDETIEMFNPVPNRLLIGLAIDPLSTPDNVILWLSHSDGSQDNGAANSGKITRVSGLNLNVVQDIVIGLPRAIANHAPNQVHFGPDGRLYLAIGGNTGAGAANTLTNSEFGVRPEQPLAAALLAFDIRNPLLDFDCTPPNDPNGVNLDATGIAEKEIFCDVDVVATGLRNSYDFTFVDGKLYATDNGLGVQGTIPEIGDNYQQGDTCEGRILAEDSSAFNPGARADLLYAIEQGGYYGHPNPSRDECVYIGGNPTNGNDWPIPQIDGAFAFLDSPNTYSPGRQPDTNWRLPEYSFGVSRSANGIIAYESDAFCGVMKKDLLVTFFSQGDQVARMIRTGSVVTDYKIMARSTGSTGGISMTNPLCITQDPLGRLFVGEFGNSRVDVFLPKAVGCWQPFPVPSAPSAVVDSGFARVGNKVFLIGGQTSSNVIRSVLVFNAFTNAWSTASSLPSNYPSVLSPAVASIGNLIYIVSGENINGNPVPNAVVYNTESDSYVNLPNVPTPRSHAVAAFSESGELYVIGGVDSSGSSSAVVEIFSPGTNSWRVGTSLPSPRDSAMGAVIGGSIYVAGGRNSLINNNALSSVVVLEVAQGQWSSVSTMPTGRRSGGAIVVKEKLLVLGGQSGTTGPANSQVEEYDPSTNTWIGLAPMPIGKRGAAWAHFGNGVFAFTGANDAGLGAVSNQVQVFRYES